MTMTMTVHGGPWTAEPRLSWDEGLKIELWVAGSRCDRVDAPVGCTTSYGLVSRRMTGPICDTPKPCCQTLAQ